MRNIYGKIEKMSITKISSLIKQMFIKNVVSTNQPFVISIRTKSHVF